MHGCVGGVFNEAKTTSKGLVLPSTPTPNFSPSGILKLKKHVFEQSLSFIIFHTVIKSGRFLKHST